MVRLCGGEGVCLGIWSGVLEDVVDIRYMMMRVIELMI